MRTLRKLKPRDETNHTGLQYCGTVLKYKVTNTLCKMTKTAKVKANTCTVKEFVGYCNKFRRQELI